MLTPLLVVLLMKTNGVTRMDATAIRDIVLQLVLPFTVGQLLRPRIGEWLARHVILTSVVDRGSILLIVYTAFSIGIVAHIWRSFDPWQVVTVAVIDTALLVVVLVFTSLIGRFYRFDRRDSVVLCFVARKSVSRRVFRWR